MAIIRPVKELLPLDVVVAGIRGAARSIVRVSVQTKDGTSVTSSGFVLTPRLIATAGYVLDLDEHVGPSGISVELPGEHLDQPVRYGVREVEVLGTPMPQVKSKRQVALLRVSRSHPLPPLQLSRDTPAAHATVHIPQYGMDKVLSLSTGRLVKSDEDLPEGLIAYDADTQPGAGGAPVFNTVWEVIAIHTVGHTGRWNAGVSRHAMLDALSSSKWWKEIAKHHQLADIRDKPVEAHVPASESYPLQPWQVGAALSSMIDPPADPTHVSWLRERCDDVDYITDEGKEVPRWVMRLEERHRVCIEAGSLKHLRDLYVAAPNTSVTAADAVVRAILDGPPYALENLDEVALGWWVQVVDWLRPVAPDLPQSAEITRLLERKHFEESLRVLARPEDFKGRERLLDDLFDWYRSDEGPLVLHGIGGIGKSAILSRFALLHPEKPLTIWLDFDRPDVAPEDAHSIIEAIHDMAALRLPLQAFERGSEPDWGAAAERLGAEIASQMAAVGLTAPPLMVLDSFEAAQYSERYQELWPVVERLMRSLPTLRVCVAGRAPIGKLVIAGKPAREIQVAPLTRDEASEFLQERTPEVATISEQVLSMTQGIPLNLQLAVMAIKAGDTFAGVPKIQAFLVAGFLQRRILGRLKNPSYKALGEAALVLRRLSADMIEPVLQAAGVKLPEGSPAQMIRELSREMGLVEPGTVLRIRPEVRCPALHLLQLEKPDWVARIDFSAERWYAGILDPAPWQRAELVYHRLRRDDIDGAAEEWRDGIEDFLDDVADYELSDTAMEWRRSRQRASPGASDDAPRYEDEVVAWEDDAIRRIIDARSRGLGRIVLDIVRERPARSANSRIVFHEAFALWERSQSDAAGKLLLEADESSDAQVERERDVLRALLARDRFDRIAADRILQPLCKEARWEDQSEPRLMALVAAAARIQLCIDFDTEIEMLRSTSQETWPLVRKFLAPTDALLPRFRKHLAAGSGSGLESAVAPAPIEVSYAEWPSAMDKLKRNWKRGHPEWQTTFAELERDWQKGHWNSAFDVSQVVAPEVRLALGLTELAWRRAFLLTHGVFPLSAIEECLRRSSWHRLGAALLGTIALFSRPLGEASLLFEGRPLADAIRDAPAAAAQLTLSDIAWDEVRGRLEHGVDRRQDWNLFVRKSGETEVVVLARQLIGYRAPPSVDPGGVLGAFLYSIVAPDPLTALAEELAGVPSRVAQTSAAQSLGTVQNAHDDDDPNKGKFGGKPSNEAAVLEAIVKPSKSDKGWYTVELLVRAREHARTALAGKTATIHLHPTFPSDVQSMVFDSNGSIRLPLVAYGAFTVGVVLPDGLGKLELDLMDVADAPKKFRES